MRRVLYAGLLTLLATAPVAAVVVSQESAPAGTVQLVPETEIDRQVRELSAELRCPVCQGLSLQDSPSALAQEMRDVVRARLESGETPDQVRQYFVGRYGEWILLEPTTSGFNLTVYLLPVLAVLLGAGILVFASRRWLASSGAGGQPDTHFNEDDPDLASWEEIASR